MGEKPIILGILRGSGSTFAWKSLNLVHGQLGGDEEQGVGLGYPKTCCVLRRSVVRVGRSPSACLSFPQQMSPEGSNPWLFFGAGVVVWVLRPHRTRTPSGCCPPPCEDPRELRVRFKPRRMTKAHQPIPAPGCSPTAASPAPFAGRRLNPRSWDLGLSVPQFPQPCRRHQGFRGHALLEAPLSFLPVATWFISELLGDLSYVFHQLPYTLYLPVMRRAGMAMPGHTAATPFCCCYFLTVPLSHISCYPKMDFELFFPNMFKHLYKSLGFPACGHHGSCRLGLAGKFLVGGVHFGVALCSMPSLLSHHLIHLHNPSWRYRRSSTDTLGDLGFFPQISFPPSFAKLHPQALVSRSPWGGAWCYPHPAGASRWEVPHLLFACSQSLGVAFLGGDGGIGGVPALRGGGREICLAVGAPHNPPDSLPAGWRSLVSTTPTSGRHPPPCPAR